MRNSGVTPYEEINRAFRNLATVTTAEMYARASHIKLLAHYTTLENLRSILSSKEFWFSHVESMKDTSEIEEGGEFVSEALGRHGQKVIKSLPFENDYVQFAFNELLDQVLEDTYVLSLCEHGSDDEADRLPMWSEYGHRGTGLCLVLRRLIIEQKAAGKFPVFWAPMEYEKEDQVADRVKKRLQLLENALKAVSGSTLRQLYRGAPQVIARCVVDIVLCHKNRAYDFEREVRFVRSPVLQTEPPPKDIQYRQIGGPKPRKIFSLPLRNYPDFPVNASIEALLDHIIIGPDAEDGMIEEVRELLISHRLDGVEARPSQIPYRSRR